MKRREFLVATSASALLVACQTTQPKPQPEPVKPQPPVVPPVARAKPKIGLALGGGAARGFAHIGVIKALETNGISPDIVVGTSAGSVVGALYAAGFGAFDLQKLAFQMEESAFKDWALFDRGLLKGEALEAFINKQVSNKPIEGLKRRFAAVATDLQNGEPAAFSAGNVGQAVRASSSVPGVFSPVVIRGREYVDGGLVSPVPARTARSMGADIVIAVDISQRPSGKKGAGSVDVLLDTIAIMGNRIADYELRDADVVVNPNIKGLPAANFQQRHEAILEGERAGFGAITRIRERLAAWDAKR
ncbi:patatin-like phospholipase family protein [Niveibacterium microcysteis]|uniref:Patatin-like phospholipase family protein n=1 Tax=Niveibacterium microcysteis TaxID=2811415 RepID=A0ABX7M3A1_9RHOO|nr:patatin-like phospholipase family protein [Niveibacterium microcysteis]QSI76230.1 patatin-like phospholipase family protein [Niveibacterium microcysteis]